MSDEERDHEAMSHMLETQFIQRFIKGLTQHSEEAGHLCFQGARLTNIEKKLDKIDSRLEKMSEERKKENNDIKQELDKHNEKIDEKLETLTEGKHKNAKDIAVLKATGYVLITTIIAMITFMGWAYSEVKNIFTIIVKLTGGSHIP